MTARIRAGEGFTMPLQPVITGVGFLPGKKGQGKSNTVAVVAEEVLAAGHPVVIIDPEGEYYTLKEEYEVLHAGAHDACDAQVGPEHAEALARLAVEQGVPIVMDLSGYAEDDDVEAVASALIKALFDLEQTARRPLLLVVDEAHEFAPEDKDLKESRYSGARSHVVAVAKRGRKRGLGLLCATQRPASLTKNVVTQADWISWHKLTWTNDTKVVYQVEGAEARDAVKTLEPGEALLRAPWLDALERVKYRRRRTFDAGQTPTLEGVETPDLKGVDASLLEGLSEVTRQQRERRDALERARVRIRDLEAEADDLRERLDSAQDLKRMGERLVDAVAASASGGNGGEIAGAVAKIREETEADLSALRRENRDLAAERDALEERLQAASARLQGLEALEADAERLARFEGRRDEVAEALARIAEALHLDVGGGADPKRLAAAQGRAERLEAEVQRLKAAGAEPLEAPTEYGEYLDLPEVREAVQDAIEDTGRPRYIKGVIANVVREGGAVSVERVTRALGIKTEGHIRSAARALQERHVARLEGGMVDLDPDGIHRLREDARRRRDTERLMEKI